jgi:large subunit ribosomal protein L21
MKKAVIQTGGRQYIVAEGDKLDVNYVETDKKTIEFVPLMIVDGKNSIVDTKKLAELKVKADIVEQQKKGEKVTSIRYKAKKRVHTVRGHRQLLTTLQIKSL